MKNFVVFSLTSFVCLAGISSSAKIAKYSFRNSQESHWVSDGSPEIQTSENVVNCTKKWPSWKYYNAMWKDGKSRGVNSGEHYWKIHFNDVDTNGITGTAVGLTNQNKFKRAEKLRGLLYGGDISNGESLYISRFGPRIKPGDTVGMLAVFVNDRLEVYFDYNGTPLGLGFDIDAYLLPDARPVIHFEGYGSATIKKEPTFLSSRTRSWPVFMGIEGTWKIVPESIRLDGNPIEYDLRSETHQSSNDFPSVNLTAISENEYDVVLRVVNYIWYRIQTTSDSWKTMNSMKTMAGSPHPVPFQLNLLEFKLADMAGSPDTISAFGNQLTLRKGETQASFVRYDSAAPTPVTGNPFSFHYSLMRKNDF